MPKNNDFIIDYICENYYSHYVDTIRLLEENRSLLNLELFKNLIKKLYFSIDYKNSKKDISNYLSFFNISYQDLDMIENSALLNDNQELPSYLSFINFLTNEKISFHLKNSYIISKNISENYWYDVIKGAINFGCLEDISEYLLRHIKNIDFCFNDKQNFYNYIIYGKNILTKKTKKDYISYIKLLKKIGFDINNKDVTGITPLHNAILKKEKQYIISIIKYSPECDIFIDNNHLWNIYLERFSHDEYNYNVYQYFLRKVPLESLKKDVGGYYLAARILNKSGFGLATKELIRKCFSFYNDKNSFKDKTIRERMIKHPRLGKMFREEEMLYLENKMIEAMKVKGVDAVEKQILRRRI